MRNASGRLEMSIISQDGEGYNSPGRCAQARRIRVGVRRCLTVVLLAVALSVCDARKYTRCGLVKDLAKHGIPRSEMPTWVCLVEAESSRNTKATHRNTDRSVDYGLFQINNRYWCAEGSRPGKDCHVTCKALLSDNISAAVKCAQFIKRRQGWSAWYGWQNKCRGKSLPNVNHCY